jgi:hypothetical protein
MTSYILFCGQEARFQTRSILIPVGDLPEDWKKDLDIMRTHARKIEFKEGVVDQVLFQNVIRKDGCGRYEQFPYTRACHKFTDLADGREEVGLEEWMNRCLYHVCSNGFNHVKNFLSMIHKLHTREKKSRLRRDFWCSRRMTAYSRVVNMKMWKK